MIVWLMVYFVDNLVLLSLLLVGIIFFMMFVFNCKKVLLVDVIIVFLLIMRWILIEYLC